jgi:Flp pilus assembly pilin Flp
MLKVFALLNGILHRDDRGITAVEYALLLAGVAVVLYTALKVFGPALGNTFSSFSTNYLPT